MRLRSATLLLVALGLLAAGCSDDKKPQTLPTLTATPSTTATPIAIPSAATVHDAFGAAAFVRFYYQQLNKAWSTPDAVLLVSLSDSDCGTCANYIKAARQFVDKGQRVRGDSVRIISAEAPPPENGLVPVDVHFDEPARAIVDASGKVLQALPASSRYHWTVLVKQTTRGWVVRAATQVKS